MTHRSSSQALVVGGGLNGLAAAYHLARLGARDVCVLERFAVGHARGSSHGPTRITRSSYDREVYVRLMAVANREEWPRLEKDARHALVHRADGCFFGPSDGDFERYAAAVARGGADVERLSVEDARRAFPAFRFPDAVAALRDRTAGVIAAKETIDGLRAVCARAGVRFLEGVRVRSIDPSRDPIAIETEGGRIECERLVVAAGAWASDLLPWLRPALTVIRQTVAYFQLEDPAAGRLGAFPPWVYLGAGENGLRYGTPAFGKDGIKAARHVVAGAGDDPNAEGAPDPRAIEEIRAFLDAELAPRVASLQRADTCLYTCTASEDYVIDLHPENPRVAIGAGFSGHGFKMGPLTGRLLAELALHGKTTVAEFEAHRAEFSASRERAR